MADLRLMSWEDRISALPVDTRRHILSFLTTRDDKLTSALSKCWRYDWLGIPCLNIGREFFEIAELFNQLRQSRTLSIQTTIIENVIIPLPLRLKSQSPLCEFEELKLFPHYYVSCLDVTRSIEALLWLCPRLKTLHIMDERLGPSRPPYAHHKNGLLKMLLKLKYKEPDELPQTGCGCYPSLPVNCWRHSLTGFEITEQQGFEDNDGSVRRFLEKSIMGV